MKRRPAWSGESTVRKLLPRVGLAVVSIVLGQWYMRLALRALFVFRQDEPLVRLVVLIGPIYTMPGGVFAAFKPRSGGIALLVAGLVSTLASVPSMELSVPSILHYVGFFGLPVCLLGLAFWLLGWRERARGEASGAPVTG